MDCRPSNVERDRLKSAMGKGYFQLFTEGRRHELEGLAHEKKDGRHCPAALRSFEQVCFMAWPPSPLLSFPHPTLMT